VIIDDGYCPPEPTTVMSSLAYSPIWDKSRIIKVKSCRLDKLRIRLIRAKPSLLPIAVPNEHYVSWLCWA
jgi:hypothetical protein